MKKLLLILALGIATLTGGTAWGATYSCGTGTSTAVLGKTYTSVGSATNCSTSTTRYYTCSSIYTSGTTVYYKVISCSACSFGSIKSNTHTATGLTYNTCSAGTITPIVTCPSTCSSTSWTAVSGQNYAVRCVKTTTSASCQYRCNAGYKGSAATFTSAPSCTKCSAGTYAAVTDSGGATSCTSCPNWSYSSAGASSCTDCLTVGTGWSKLAGTGWTAFTSCIATYAAPTSVCTSGVFYRAQKSATAWGDITTGTVNAKAGKYVDTANLTCTNVSANCYQNSSAYTGTSTCPSSCPSGYPYSSAGSTVITACYSGTKSRAWSGGQNACSKADATVTCNSCSGSACDYVAYSNSAGTGDGTIKSGCSTNSANCNQTVKTYSCNANHYDKSGTCTDCPSGYPYSSAGSTVITACYSGTKSRAWSGGQNACSKANATVTCNSCSGSACDYVAYSNSAGTGDGTIKSGCSTNSANCNQTVKTYLCLANYYDKSGTCTSCSTDTSAKYPYSAAGSDAITDCYSATKSRAWSGSAVDGSVPTNCYSATWGTCSIDACNYVAYSNAAGTGDGTVKSGCSSNGSNCTKPVASVTAKKGAYVNGKTCSVCSSGYQNTDGSTATSCTACVNTNYTATGSALTNHDAASDCTITCKAGNYVASVNAACSTCPAGYKCPSDITLSQGSTGGATACTGATYQVNTGQTSCTSCPTAANDTTDTDVTSYGYWNTGQTGDHTVREGCYAVFAGRDIDNGSVTAYKCYIDADTNAYGAAETGKTCWVEKAALKCDAAFYSSKVQNGSTQPSQPSLAKLFSSTCTSVGTGYYSAADALTRTQCPANYRSGGATDAEGNCQTYCSGGTYVATQKAACTGVGTGYYKAAHYVKYGATSSRSGCSNKPDGSSYSGSASSNSCPWVCDSGKYGSSAAGSTSCPTCEKGYMCSDGTRTACTGFTYQDEEGKTSCKDCVAPTLYASTATKSYWISGGIHTSKNNCLIHPNINVNNGTVDNFHCYYNPTDNDYGTTNSNCYYYAKTCTAGNYSAGGSGQINKKSAQAVVDGACTGVGDGYYSADGAIDRSACSALTGANPTGGSYSSVSPRSAATNCRYTAKSKTITGCKTVTTNTVSYSGSAYPATTYSVTADGGYYISNNNTASATCTTCIANHYCTGGTASPASCSNNTGAKYTLSAAGSNTVSDCYLSTSAKSYVAEESKGQVDCAANGYCPGGTTVYYNDTEGTRTITGGRTLCNTVGDKTYTLSAAKQSADTACYKNCTRACTQTCNKANATCTFATSSKTGQNYYGSSGCNAPSSTCAITGFTCNSGYNQNFQDNCIAQCAMKDGKFLRTGTGIKIPLYAEKVTGVAIHFQDASGTMCYANLAENEAAGTINVRYNGKVYHTVQ